MERSLLLKQIEKHREEMLSLSETYSLTSKRVVAASQKLDALINKEQMNLLTHSQ